MPETTDEIGYTLSIRPDPAIWLVGPLAHETATEWIETTLEAVAEDFGVAAGSAESTYLHSVLTSFATAELGSPFRLLRLRALADAPLVARLDVLAAGAADPLAEFGHGFAWYDHGPRTEVVEGDPSIRRATRLYVDDGVRAVVRLHRRLADDGPSLLLACAGFTLAATASGLDDLIHLTQCIEIKEMT